MGLLQELEELFGEGEEPKRKGKKIPQLVKVLIIWQEILEASTLDDMMLEHVPDELRAKAARVKELLLKSREILTSLDI